MGGGIGKVGGAIGSGLGSVGGKLGGAIGGVGGAIGGVFKSEEAQNQEIANLKFHI